jgi:hypothetical protein
MDTWHADRLRRARDLLAVKGFQAEETILACDSGEGFSNGLRALADRDPGCCWSASTGSTDPDADLPESATDVHYCPDGRAALA